MEEFTKKVIGWLKDHKDKVEETPTHFIVTHKCKCQMIFDKDWRLVEIKASAFKMTPKTWCKRE